MRAILRGGPFSSQSGGQQCAGRRSGSRKQIVEAALCASVRPSILALAMVPGGDRTRSIRRRRHGDQHQANHLFPSPPRCSGGGDPEQALRHRHVPPRLRRAGRRQLGGHEPRARLPRVRPHRDARALVSGCQASCQGAKPAGCLLARRRLRRDRRRCLHQGRHPGLQPVRCQQGGGGRARPGPHARHLQEDHGDRPGDTEGQQRRALPLHRDRAARQDDRHHRPRQYRLSRRRDLQNCFPHDGARLRPLSIQGEELRRATPRRPS